MRKTWGRLSVILAAGTLAIVACAPATVTPPAATVTQLPSTDRVPAPSAPDDPVPDAVWPLTGVDATEAAPELLGLPAISVKVPNDSKARPHHYLDHADIVFEEYVEGGIPRFIAVFQSDFPETLGPIRSLREMDPNIMGSIGGALVFSGANPNVMNSAKATGQKLLAEDLGSGGFFRTKDRVAPYNLHIRLADMVAQAADLPAPVQQFNYAYPSELATAVTEGDTAHRIDLRFSGHGEPSWDWDTATGTYLRNEFTSPAVTADGTRLSATNVVVLHVHIYTNWELPVSQMIVSDAAGYVATGGKYIPILWSKADRTSNYVLTTLDGAPVQLAPGKTWVELVPNSGVSGTYANFS